MGNSCENLGTFIIISLWFLLRMRNVTDKRCRENQNTRFVFSNFFSKNCAVYEILWKNMVTARQFTDDNVVWHMRFACWITKITDTPSEYVILIAFPQQQSLCEHVSVLHYSYIVSLVYNFWDGVKWIPWYCDCLLACCTILRWQMHDYGVQT